MISMRIPLSGLITLDECRNSESPLIENSRLRSEAIPRVRLSRHSAAQCVNRSAAGKEDRLQVGAAKGEIGRDLRGADYAEPGPVRREHPGAARSGAIDPAL